MNKMTQMTKRLLMLLAAVSSAAVLAACEPSEPTATDTTEDPAQVEAVAPETDTTETVQVPDETVTTEAIATEETDTSVTEATSETEETIVAIASGDSTFSTLVAAIEAAELAETLSGEGPYTVFAPTDEAFAALPEGTVEELLKPENKDKLIQVLTYHVVPAKVLSTDIQAGPVETVQGEALAITVDPGTNEVKVNDSTVVKTDIVGSNGVIHVIDGVVLPPN